MVEKSWIERFLEKESAVGILLILAATCAILIANSPFHKSYELLIETPVAVRVGALEIAKPLLLWINDGLMAVFFLLVGLELKREFVEGEFSDSSKIILPALGAVGGMVAPAAVYLALNYSDPVAVDGWAIPAATDIAFALGVLALLGSRVPSSLKIFLTSLAIFDDIGAILVIALFYTSKISLVALTVAGCCVVVLAIFNRMGVVSRSLYLLVGLVMWVALLKSGVHATLAGVLLAMFIPIKTAWPDYSPLKNLEHDLHAAVYFVILPVFAFSNAGVDIRGAGLSQILHPIPLGIALGLLIGKQVGIFGFCLLGIKLGLTAKPKEISWMDLYGTSLLAGIGFTMSLFIGSLAFEESGVNMMFDERLGIILGSLASGLLGYFVLRSSLRRELS